MRERSTLARLASTYRVASLGAIVVTVFVTAALLAAAVAPVDPNAIGTVSFRAPAPGSFLGTDNLGRDVLSRMLYGARTSLVVGFLAAFGAMSVGVLVGAISGYYGGRVDDLLMRFTELFQVTPRLILAIVVVALFGASVWIVVAVIAVVSWPTTARLVRAQVLSLRVREFVQAAHALGASDARVIGRAILPNVAGVLVVEASFQAANAILLEAGLSFLGLGDPALVSWGLMLQQAQPFLRRAWWLAVFPGGAIALVVLGLNLFGDGLNDALNPRRAARRGAARVQA
jgi:peptide/nickel transport system permease protein